jgi:hypothetical protein
MSSRVSKIEIKNFGTKTRFGGLENPSSVKSRNQINHRRAACATFLGTLSPSSAVGKLNTMRQAGDWRAQGEEDGERAINCATTNGVQRGKLLELSTPLTTANAEKYPVPHDNKINEERAEYAKYANYDDFVTQISNIGVKLTCNDRIEVIKYATFRLKSQ